MIFATCATIAAVLAAASPGDTIRLVGDCPASITIARSYVPSITIEAAGARVAGVVITGGGVTWRGGTLRARGGYDGVAQAGYGLQVQAGRNVTVEGVRFIEAKKAVVLNSAVNVAVRFSRFELGEDGVIASQGANLDISHNEFVSVKKKPTNCTIGPETLEGLSRSVCLNLGGSWLDGWHEDAIQYRNGIVGLIVLANVINGTTQGAGNMEGATDARVRDVRIDGNQVAVTGFNSITDYVSLGRVIIARNVVRSMTPDRKVPIRFGAGAIVCGNTVARAGDPGALPCEPGL